MKADPFVQLKLLDVQALDAKADNLRHQRASLPQLAEIATLSATRAELADQIRDQQIVDDDLTAAQTKADADVYVTSDLRHHPAAEFLEKGGPSLVDVAHWAAEWTWLPVVEERLRVEFAEGRGDTVETRVSTINTDPWTDLVGPTPKGDA